MNIRYVLPMSKARKDYTDKLGRTWKWNGTKYVYQRKGTSSSTGEASANKETTSSSRPFKDISDESLSKYIAQHRQRIRAHDATMRDMTESSSTLKKLLKEQEKRQTKKAKEESASKDLGAVWMEAVNRYKEATSDLEAAMLRKDQNAQRGALARRDIAAKDAKIARDAMDKAEQAEKDKKAAAPITSIEAVRKFVSSSSPSSFKIEYAYDDKEKTDPIWSVRDMAIPKETNDTEAYFKSKFYKAGEAAVDKMNQRLKKDNSEYRTYITPDEKGYMHIGITKKRADE